ncbi:MAG: MGDG synthase-domain-containing protein [Monoraphidium minutum]|nr:MAG: MGDG synthase-domain-containing protein [Monoraphidium minutum]
MLPTAERDTNVPNFAPPHLTGFILGAAGASARFVAAPRGGGGAPAVRDWAADAPALPAARHRSGPGRRTPTASGRAPGGSGNGGGSGSSGWLRGGSASWVAFRAGLGGVGMGIGAGGMFCGPAKADLLRLFPFPGRRRKATKKDGQKTVLIMMSNTGGGHKASAEALQQAFQEEYGDDYKVVIVDMWKEHTPAPFNNLCDSYSFLVRHGVLWRLTYNVMNPRLIHRPYFAAIQAVVSRQLSAAFDAYDPDLVVSVHPLMQHIPVRVLAARAKAKGGAPPPFATVVTDFTTCHNTWFYPKVTRCFVPTDYCKALALAMGVPESKVITHGLPIRPVFCKRLPSKAALRNKLGLLKGVPAVLLVGGGEGMGAIAATVRELDGQLRGGAQVAVICGRNKKLLRQLAEAQWPGGSHVVPVGFVDNMHEWMGAVDVIITKAGPGTIAEALISGLPILLNGNVPCQEEGNIPYVVDNGVGAFETDPPRIAAIIAGWLDPANADAFREMGRRSKALGRPRAVYNIARDLAALVQGAAALAAEEAAAACCKGGRGAAGALVAAA